MIEVNSYGGSHNEPGAPKMIPIPGVGGGKWRGSMGGKMKKKVEHGYSIA